MTIKNATFQKGDLVMYHNTHFDAYSGDWIEDELFCIIIDDPRESNDYSQDVIVLRSDTQALFSAHPAALTKIS